MLYVVMKTTFNTTQYVYNLYETFLTLYSASIFQFWGSAISSSLTSAVASAKSSANIRFAMN